MVTALNFTNYISEARAGDHCSRGIHNRTGHKVVIEIKKSGTANFKTTMKPHSYRRFEYHNDVRSIAITRLNGYRGREELSVKWTDRGNVAHSSVHRETFFGFSGWGDNKAKGADLGVITDFTGNKGSHPSCYWVHDGRTKDVVLNSPANGDISISDTPQTQSFDCVIFYTGLNGTGQDLQLCGHTSGWYKYINLGTAYNPNAFHYIIRSFTCAKGIDSVEFIDGNRSKLPRLFRACSSGKVINLDYESKQKATGVKLRAAPFINGEKLANKLAGSYWQYTNNGRTFVFRFGIVKGERGYIQDHMPIENFRRPSPPSRTKVLKWPMGSANKIIWGGKSSNSIELFANGCPMVVKISDRAGNAMKSESLWCSYHQSLHFKRYIPTSGQTGNSGSAFLTQRLIGSNWSYTLGAHIVKFRFGKNGAIEGHAPWSRVRWQASSNNAVLLSASTGARMTLDFSDLDNFRAKNWGSKDIAVGKRIAWLTAPKHVLLKRALTGTFWSLTAGNYHNNFKFAKNGKLQHGSWNNRVKWRVSGDNIVTLYGANNALMKLNFNGDKSFTTRGWNDLGWNRKTLSSRNNQVATGRRLDRRLETPKVNNRLRQPGCTTLASARSTGGGQKVTATFVNAAGTRLMAYWIDFSGKQKFYKSIEPDERFVIDTSTKHPWIMRTIDNACRAIIMPSANSKIQIKIY